MFRWSKKKKHPEIPEDGTPDLAPQRFTVILPNGHKSVTKVSPLVTVGNLVGSVCKDKGLDPDLSQYDLQIPKQPGIPVDPDMTVQQIGVHELILVSLGRPDRNHTVSMPDLSKPPPSDNHVPSFTISDGPLKKKRGFFSFIGKREKKYKQDKFRSLNNSFSSSLDVSAVSTPVSMTPSTSTATTPTSIHRQDSSHGKQVFRPASMYETSSTPQDGDKSSEQRTTPLIAPPRKKRQAPPPPVTGNIQISENHQHSLKNSIEIQKNNIKNSLEVPLQIESNHQQLSPHDVALSQEVSGKDRANTNQSSTSSDSSGYHDYTLGTSESVKYNTPDINKINAITDFTPAEVVDSFNSSSFSPIEVPLKDEALKRSNDKMVSESLRSISDSSKSDSSETAISDETKVALIASQSQSRPDFPTSNVESSSLMSVRETTTNRADAPQTNKNQFTMSLQPPSAATTFTPEKQVEVPVTSHHKELHISNVSNNQAHDNSDKAESRGTSSTFVTGFDESKNEASYFDINDILDGIVFEDDPWPMKKTLAKRPGIGSSSKDRMMMIETSSVKSESFDQGDDSSYTERPCSFNPPPPPSEPPPTSHQSVNLESFIHISAPVFVDKGTIVSDDNVSLATSSAKSSPDNGKEMATFATETSYMSMESSHGKDHQLLTETATSFSIADSNTKNKYIPWLEKTNFTNSAFNPRVLTESTETNLRNIDFQAQVEDSSDMYKSQNTKEVISSERSVKSLRALFSSSDNLQTSEISDSDDEYYTEITEELTIPFGPNGYDFAAARRKEGSDIRILRGKLDKSKNKKNNLIATDSVGKVSSELTSIHQSQPISSFTPTHQSQLVPSPPKLVQKETFSLTITDLSHANLTPPKPESTKPKVNTSPYNKWSSPPTTPANYGNTTDIRKTADSASSNNVHYEITQVNTSASFEDHDRPAAIKEPTAVPVTKAITQASNISAFSDDEQFSLDLIFSKSKPHLLMNANSSSSRKPRIDRTGNADYPRNSTSVHSSSSNGAGSDAVADNVEQPGSKTSAYNDDTAEQQDALQHQCYALQSQLNQWQEQLARKQSTLPSQAVGSEPGAEHLQQIKGQIVIQQQMIQQLQETMHALQQQNTHGSEQEHAELPAQFPARVHPPLAGAAEPAIVAAESQPATLQPEPAQKKATVLKSGNNPSTNKSRFQKELGTREQLMIAIRTFSKKELMSVPIEKTRWTSAL